MPRESYRERKPYSLDAYTLVRNHPLMIVSQQTHCSELIEHEFHIKLRTRMFKQFGSWWLAFSLLAYAMLLALWTTFILSGKHPQYFYELAGLNMTIEIDRCQQVATYLVSQNVTEALKTDDYKRIQLGLYVLLVLFLVKNLIIISALFPKVFRTGAYYIEASALVLAYVYILDWYPWQLPIIFRCPVQYQVGAVGLLLCWMNLIAYVRCIPYFKAGAYVTMLQVISWKFLSFLPVLTIILCGFGFTYWMLLQNQNVYATPIEALMRTCLMIFDLGYESRLYGSADQPAHYKLVYVLMMVTAIIFPIFIINLMIGKLRSSIPHRI